MDILISFDVSLTCT